MSGSIKRKILLTNAVVLILMIGASHLVTYLHWRRQLLDFGKEQGWAMVSVSQSRIYMHFLSGDIRGIRDLMKTLVAHRSVRAIRITDREGNVLISSAPQEEHQQRIDIPERVVSRMERVATPATLTDATGGLDFYVPIRRGPECRRCHYANEPDLAVLQIDVAATRLTRILRVTSYQVLIVAVLTVGILFLALLWLFRREINRPVAEILDVMRRAKTGNLSARAPVRRSDELGLIAAELNGMLAQLGGAREQLREMHQQELERQERLATIGNLASAVAHEIKNPLAGIRGGMEVLEHGLPPDDSRREITQEITREVDRINRMVRDLLYYSRQPVPETVPARLDVVVDDVLAQARQLPGAEKIAIVHHREDAAPSVAIDYQLVKQAFLNVIQNAFDAMGS